MDASNNEQSEETQVEESHYPEPRPEMRIRGVICESPNTDAESGRNQEQQTDNYDQNVASCENPVGH